MLSINKTIENEKAVIAPTGRLDTVSAPELEAVIKNALPGLKSLTLDLAGLDYISSAGLRVLLAAQKTMNAQGEMRVIRVNKSIMDIFELTGFSEILTIEKNEEEA